MEEGKKKECEDCPTNLECSTSKWAWILFLIGLIATIGMRVIQPLNLINPLYGKLAWYVGVSGFFVFFIFKFSSDHKITKQIKEKNLYKKLSSRNQLKKEDCVLIKSTFCSLTSGKDKLNFFFHSIFFNCSFDYCVNI